MKILRSFSDQVIGIRSIVDHKTEIGHSFMIIFFRKQKNFFLWLVRPKNLPCNQIWWRVRERERAKKNHILSFDIYRIVSSSSMICRISHYFPVFGNQKRVKACDLHANTSKRVEIHVFFELNMQITSRPWYGYVCM